MHCTFDGGIFAPLLYSCAMKISGIQQYELNTLFYSVAFSCFAKKKKENMSKVHLFPLVSQQKIREVMQPEPQDYTGRSDGVSSCICDIYNRIVAGKKFKLPNEHNRIFDNKDYCGTSPSVLRQACKKPEKKPR